MYRKKKLWTNYHLIAANPFDNEETLDESFKFVSKLPMEYGYISINRFITFPHSPLETLIKDNKPANFDPKRWYFIALVYYLRTIVGDDCFDKIRHTRLFMDHPDLLNELIIALVPATKSRKEQGDYLIEEDLATRVKGDFNYVKECYHKLFIQKLKRDRITAFGSIDFLKEVYEAYLSELAGQSVLIWGTEGFYRELKDNFSEVTIEAFIDNDSSKQYKLIDEIPVNPPSYLRNCRHPVFICSSSKEEIFNQIRQDYAHIEVIP
jgi:hypothetical protein